MKSIIISVFAVVLFSGINTHATMKTALVYDGPGSCSGTGLSGCTAAAEAAAQWSGYSVRRIGPDALKSTSTEADYQQIFGNASVWVQPGGGSKTFLTTATPELKKAIRRFILEGGGYVGFCAGAFSATATDGALTIAGLNIFPGKTYPYISETIDFLFDDVVSKFSPDSYNNHIYEVNWSGRLRHVYFEEGPQLLLNAEELKNVEVMATFRNGVPASARSSLGRGRVYITGLHPEAPPQWKSHPDMDSDPQDYDLVQSMLDWASGETTSEVPVPAEPFIRTPSLSKDKYLNLTATYVTTVHQAGQSQATQLGTSELTVTAYDAASDSYTVRLSTYDAVTGQVKVTQIHLATHEFDTNFSDSMFRNCKANYGQVFSQSVCKLSSSTTDLYVKTGLFGLQQAVSVDPRGSVFVTHLQGAITWSSHSESVRRHRKSELE